MYCPKCGVENADGVQLCQSCSWVLAGVSAAGVSENAKTSGLAITSLVLMILSFFIFFLTALPAIIFGIVALVKIEKSGGRLKGKGLAIAGIAAPVALLPFIAMMAMMLAIMMPALGKTKLMAQRLVCGTNLKGLGNAMVVYAFDYEDKYPTGSRWCDLLAEEADVGAKSFICRGAADDGPGHYAMNENIERLGADATPDMVLLFETDEPGWNLVGGSELLSTENHRGDGCNVLFMDGHVEFVKSKDVGGLRWDENQVVQKKGDCSNR
jgi:prepilin-type processing-associated H-X9-DG protein